MTQKFGRNYRLTIWPRDGGAPILITMPFTLRFSLRRSFLSNQNSLELEIYNLSEPHRNSIYQDWFDYGTSSDAGAATENIPADGNNIILEAGYNNLYKVFAGVIWRASTAREGTNLVTKISAYGNNADIVTTRTFQTLQSGQTLGQLLQFLIGQFPQLAQGNVLNYSETFNRPVVLNGITWNLLKQYSNANVFIDNGKIYVLREDEALNVTTVIDDAAGILETPRREPGTLYVTCLFEPSVNVGELVQLQSSTQQSYNGLYRVQGVMHQGTISGAVCGKLVTVFELLATNPFNGFTKVDQPTAPI